MRNLEAKKQLRAKLKQLRNALSKEEQSDLSYRITEKVVSHYDFGRAKNILIYMHYNSEVQTDGIILYAFMLGKTVFIPKVEGSEMNFSMVSGVFPNHRNLQRFSDYLRIDQRMKHLSYYRGLDLTKHANALVTEADIMTNIWRQILIV